MSPALGWANNTKWCGGCGW